MLWKMYPSYYYVFEPGDFVSLFQHWFLFLFLLFVLLMFFCGENLVAFS